jgi:hypothetical protein
MKKLIPFLIAAIAMGSCKKEISVREPEVKVQSLPGDPELVNTTKDAEAVAYRKNNPHGNPHGNGGGGGDTTNQPPQPPPTIVHKACWLLDFDGYNVPAGAWDALGFYCTGSDFTTAEIADIKTRIKNYWAQFDVEITTDEALYNTYSVNKRMRVVYTRTNFWPNAGGVAYIGSLLWTDTEKQCFVFPDMLQRNTKYNADAGAHEMGHTAGCYHHAELRNDQFGACYVYNAYLWSNHIMGACYYDLNPLFNTGDKACGVKTDDIAKINSAIN